MTVPARPLTEITNQALHVLTKEIGVADTMRFLSQFSTGTGNYTEERAALFDHLSLNDVLLRSGRKAVRAKPKKSFQETPFRYRDRTAASRAVMLNFFVIAFARQAIGLVVFLSVLGNVNR